MLHRSPPFTGPIHSPFGFDDGGPTLDIDFTTGKASSPYVFTRASSGVFIGSNGLIQSAGSNALRIDYDPITRACKGALIEEQRTNLVLQSAAFDNASWTKSSIVVTADQIAAPDGTTTADLLTKTATAFAAASQAITATALANYVQTVYFKAGSLSNAALRIICGTSDFGCDINLSAGTSALRTNVGTGGLIAVQNMGGGWYRAGLWMQAPTASTLTAYFYSGNTGDAIAGTVYAWGAQLEAAAFPTSYIATTTATATRAVDDLRVTTITPWSNSSASTLAAEVDVATFANFPTAINDITTAAAFLLFDGSGHTRTNDGTTNLTTANTGTAGAVVKSAVAFSSGLRRVGMGGGTVVVDAVSNPFFTAGVRLGDYRAGGNSLNGHFRRLRYWPRALVAAELQQATT